MYRPRHAKKESIFSILFTLFMMVTITGIVVTYFFGSWEKFMIEIIDVLPWGEALFKTIAQLLDVSLVLGAGSSASVFGSVWEDCVKLLIAAVLLPIARFFTGADRPMGKHAAPLSISGKILWFFVDKLATPVIVAVVSAWLVEYLSGKIWSLGNAWSWVLSIAGTLATVGVSVWVFYILAAQTVWWGIAYMLAKVIPAAISALFSYAFLILILLIGASPEYISVIAPIALMFLAIIFLLGLIMGKTDSFFKL